MTVQAPRNDRPSGEEQPVATLGSGTGARIKILLIVVAVVAAIALSPKLRGLERTGLVELSELGDLAPLVLLQGYVVASLLFLPVFPLDLAAGAHFRFLEGVLWVQLAATVGSLFGYFLGRSVLRRFVDRLMQRKPKLARIQRAVEREGWKIVFLSRLSPIFSFSLLNVFYGSVRVPFVPFVLSTLVGILPGTALYVYAGEMAGDLSGTPLHPQQTTSHWILEILGFVVTAVVVTLVTRYASRALSASMEEDDRAASSGY
ncbi:MAG: TVP38/TMEM64 family protein [bacterium]|nr:TVP38/TMEM64 family protein [bacterium]